MLGDLMVNGSYNISGHLGSGWLKLPITSDGDRSFRVSFLNTSISIEVSFMLESQCNVRMTQINVPILYDDVKTEVGNFDESFETVIDGVLKFILDMQMKEFVSWIKDYMFAFMRNVTDCP